MAGRSVSFATEEAPLDWQRPETSPTPYEIYHGPRRSRIPTALAVLALAVFALVGAGVAVGAWLFGEESGEPGRPTEQHYLWPPATGPRPALVDATGEWGFSAWRHTGTDQASGGVAVADIDEDGLPDVVVGGGSLAIFFAAVDGPFEQASGALEALTDEVTSVGVRDVDLDGAVDVLVGTGGADLVVWGGPWAARRDITGAEVTELEGGRPTTGLLVGDFTGDGLPDIVRLGYGPAAGAAAPDVLWERVVDRRTFEPRELPGSARRSLAAELADVDEDGLTDIWVARDTGWQDGPNSLYSRRGADEGPFHDMAPGLGADQAIDGMGISLADLTGDGVLDAYLTDVGDNEVLIRRLDRFEPSLDSGAARIRPLGADPRTISSSWGSGVTDLNLDGRLDILVVNGGFDGMANKVPDTEVLVQDPPAIFLGIGGGRFADVWPELGLPWTGSSRGLAIADLDRDGDSDVLIVNHGAGIMALRNDGDASSLAVRPSSLSCDLAGTTVTVDLASGRVATLLAAHSFLGAHAPEVVLGTGANRRAEVTVRRPSEDPLTETVELADLRTVYEYPCP